MNKRGYKPAPFKKYLIYGGKIKIEDCTDHFWRWTGRIPCTGVQACIYCGKIKDYEDEQTKNN